MTSSEYVGSATTSDRANSSNDESGQPWNALAFALDGGLGAGSAARRVVLASGVTVPTRVSEDLLLLVTELVNNAVRHADVGPDRSLRVELTRRPQSVRVEVADPGVGDDSKWLGRTHDEDGGWGFLLLGRMADSWGITSRADGTRAWFELAVDA